MKFTNCVALVGSKPMRYEGTKRYVSTGALAVDHIDEESVELVGYEDRPSRADLTAESGDVLFAKMADTKKTILLDDETAENIYSTGFFAVRAKPGMITPECLYYLLTSGVFLRQKNKHSSGATQRAITNKGLEAIDISIPNLDEQTRLVAKLNALSKVIKSREQQLIELDNLIKARFVEMFGDPYTNPFGWEEVNISKVVKGKVSNGFFAKRDDYTEDGNVSVLGVAYVVNRMYSQVEQLPKTNASERDVSKFEVSYGDMLFCRSSLVAEGIGKASIVPEDAPKNVLFECHVIRLPLNLDLCVPEFMQVLTTTDYFRKQIIAQSKTATMTTIGQDGILKANIVLPPIEEQQKFYKFVKQVDKSKVVVQKALEEAQLLFDSLMQEYFG